MLYAVFFGIRLSILWRNTGNMARFIDTGSLIVATISLLLFVAALFVKGLTHDLFLEAGVLLVSVKIIVMSYRNSVAAKNIDEKLDTVIATLSRAGNVDKNVPKPSPASDKDAS
jgi:hypothetical protein